MPNVSAQNALANVLDAPRYTAIVPVANTNDESLIREVHNNADAAELRIDLMDPFPGLDGLLLLANKFGRLPLLATFREESHGGDWSGNPYYKVGLLAKVSQWVHGIDIEYDFPLLDEVVQAADERVVIASMHDFDGVPSFATMMGRYERARRAGADYFKVAATPRHEGDIEQLSLFMRAHQGDPVIAVAMGEYGIEGRKRLLRLGSRATYAYVGDDPLVPGQLSLAEYREFAETQPRKKA